MTQNDLLFNFVHDVIAPVFIFVLFYRDIHIQHGKVYFIFIQYDPSKIHYSWYVNETF